MKNVLIIFAMLLLQVGVSAQDSDVPVNVQKALKAKYAAAEQVDWIVTNNYTATFWEKDLYKEATFSKSGEWMETSTVLDETAVPVTIKQSIVKAVGKMEITYAVQMDKNDDSKTYVIDVSTEEDSFQITTDMTGKVLKKEVVEYEEAEEDDGF